MATALEQTVHSGHTIQIKVGTEVVGRIQGLDGDRSFGTEGVYEIGSMMPQEHVTNRYEGSITMERFFVREKSLHELGYSSVNENVLRTPIFTIEVLDKYTGKLVRAYHGCTAVNYRETFRVGAIAGENATWTYLYSRASDSDKGYVQ